MLPVDRRARREHDHHGRPPGRPWQRAVDRLVDRLTGLSSWLGPVGRRGRPGMGRLTGRSTPVDRQTRFLLSFGIRILFLDGIESNLGFLKFRDSVAINKG